MLDDNDCKFSSKLTKGRKSVDQETSDIMLIKYEPMKVFLKGIGDENAYYISKY